MKYTLQELFEVIDEKKEKEEFYYAVSSGGFGTDYYLSKITRYTPNEKIIISSNRNEKQIRDANIKDQKVEVDGLLLFEYISHTEEYKITRLSNIEEVVDIICDENGILNMFSGDIAVIKDGKRKKYYVRDQDGKFIIWNDINKIKEDGSKIYIEWL